MKTRVALVGVLLLAVLAGCPSPEATRTRAAGARSGADVGNWSEVVQMHEGSTPYYGTPRLIEPYGHPDLAPGRQAHRLSLEEGAGKR